MSLAEAVLDIVEEMEMTIETNTSADLCRDVLSWAKQIRRAVKASGGIPVETPMAKTEKILTATHLPTPAGTPITFALNQSPLAARDPWPLAEKERLEKERNSQKSHQDRIRQDQAEAAAREESGTKLTYLVGGDLDGDMMPLNPSMPVGAKTLLSGQVYVLEADRKLHFSQEETIKFNERKA